MSPKDNSTSKDPLGDRMKHYEQQSRTFIRSNSYAVLRLDGRAFHTWTKGLERPYDLKLIEIMAQVMEELCKSIANSSLGLHQSDEISIFFTDTGREETQHWFGGNIQKIVSVASSIASGYFIRAYPDRSLATFDARVSVLPSITEVMNYFQWRQADGERNAISMIASEHFSAKELHGASTTRRAEMLTEKGIDISLSDPRFLSGQICYRSTRKERVEYTDKRTKEKRLSPLVERHIWEHSAASRLDTSPSGWLTNYFSQLS